MLVGNQCRVICKKGLLNHAVDHLCFCWQSLQVKDGASIVVSNVDQEQVKNRLNKTGDLKRVWLVTIGQHLACRAAVLCQHIGHWKQNRSPSSVADTFIGSTVVSQWKSYTQYCDQGKFHTEPLPGWFLLPDESVQVDVVEDLACNGEEGDTPIILTVCFAAFVLVQHHNQGISKVIRHLFMFPDSLNDAMENLNCSWSSSFMYFWWDAVLPNCSVRVHLFYGIGEIRELVLGGLEWRVCLAACRSTQPNGFLGPLGPWSRLIYVMTVWV